ncbi:GGDEF domain-containing protein [Shewanella cyperi]|nr:membrane-associated sensor domain-containing protein [Shewanella cyperi]
MRAPTAMDQDIPEFKSQLRLESALYVQNGLQWVSAASLLLLAAITLNWRLNEIGPADWGFFMAVLPLAFICLLGAMFLGHGAVHPYSRWLLLVFLMLLVWCWLLFIAELLQVAPQSIAAMEAVADILVLLLMMGLFPDALMIAAGQVPLVCFICLSRYQSMPENLAFPLSKFICLLVIIAVGQQVLFSWFSRAIAGSVEKQKLLKQFRRLALVDGLTNLSNRRHLDELLKQEIRAAQRNGRPLCLLLLDIDYFKRLNDSLGHQAGDDCLVQVAALLSDAACRPRDLAARYGGEEFVLLLPETPLEGALAKAQSVAALLHQRNISHPDSPIADRVTASQGICQWQPGMDADALLQSCDRRLYRAKGQGRNCIIVSG